MKKSLCSMLAFLTLGASAVWNIQQSDDGKYITLSNDSPTAIQNRTTRSVALAADGVWIKKEFFLNKLPANWRSGVKGAWLRIYSLTADQSKAVKKLPQLNGLTEKLVFIINGKSFVLPLSDKAFRGSYSWIDIPFSPDMITGDVLTVQIHKERSTTSDDYFYALVDTSSEPETSTMSIDSGKTFVTQTKFLGNVKGEFMIKLILGRENTAPAPAVVVKPAAKPAAKPAVKPVVAPTPANVKWDVQITEGGNCLILGNDSPDAVKNKTTRIFPMSGSLLQLRKEFDLSKLPADWKGKLGGASLRIYCMVADQSKAVKKLPKLNGFTEEISLKINGTEMIIPTGSKLLKTSYGWIDIPLAPEMITGDKLAVQMTKRDSATNDDYFYVQMDTSCPPGASTMSANNGRTFHHKISPLGNMQGEFMIKLVLYKGKREAEVNFSKDPNAASAVELKNGAVISNGLLKLNGMDAVAVLKNSANFNVTETGLTISGVFRMVGNENTPSKKNHNMIIACKDGSWFIGRTGNQLNFSFCTDGSKWNNALFGSEFPDLGEWVHLAAVFQRVYEPAQGNVGYLLSLYLNGELAGRKMFLYAEPTITNNPVIIGQGLEDYGFNGEFASFEVISRGLNEGEIDNLVKKADYISKLPPGFFEVEGNLNAALDKAVASAKNPAGKWLAESLRRAAATGAVQSDIMAVLKKVSPVIASGKKGKALADAWNAACSEFTLIDGGNSMLLVVSGKGKTTSPITGLFNNATGNDVFDGRNTGWLLNFDGKQIHDRSNGVTYEVSPVEFSKNGGKFSIKWQGKGFECLSNVSFADGRLEQDFEVRNDGSEVLSVVDFPRYFFRKLPGKKDFLVFPSFSGYYFPNPTHSFGRTGIYPSAHSTMQFVGYYDNLKNGVYAAFEETDASMKTQCVSGRSNIMEYKWNNPVALPLAGGGGNDFKSAGNAVIQIYSGDWFEAGQIYKKFVEAKAPWAVTELPRKDTPAWYRDNCLWMVASKEHYRALEYLREYFDIPYAVWYARWQEYVNDNGYMRIDINAESAFAAKRLIPKGVYLHPYLNGRLFEFSEACVYTPNNSSQNAVENCLIQSNGKPEIERYKYAYFRMCPDTEYWQNALLKMAKSVSDSGLNGCYFDQLPCASPCPCYAKNHGHEPNDPSAWVRGYTKMLKELRRRHPQLGLDGEDNCEVYANTLDGFMTWRFGGENHLPLFQSIYGGGRTQFTARGFDAFGGNSGSYEASFAKMGEQFVYGEQIGWLHIFDIRWGTPRRIYAKKLAHLRRAMLGYLNEADMLRPLDFKGEVPKLTCLWGSIPGGMVTSDKIMSCAWKRLRDGRIAVLFTNITDEELTVLPATRYPGYDKLAVCTEGVKGVQYIDLAKSGNPAVKLGPYASCIWLLGKDFDKAEAAKIAETTCKVASFTDSGKSIHYRTPEFNVCKKLDATSGKWFTAQDSSWLLYAFKEVHPSLGFNTGSYAPKEQLGNWIMARAGGVVHYGEVDFGSKQPKYIEVQIAVGKENVGGKIFLDDITGRLEPYYTLAEYTTEYTGGWFKWKTVRIPITGELTGKRKIVFRFEDKDCCFRGWRVIY